MVSASVSASDNYFEFSEDTLKLEPLSGELKPNTHVNIKMTLSPCKFPTYFEGEIQCSIDWENAQGDHIETKSVHTNTNVPESSEYLFLRLKKRSKIVSDCVKLTVVRSRRR